MDKLNLKKYGLVSEQSFDPLSFEKLKADSYNMETGNLSGIDCKKCLNRGNIAFLNESGSVRFKECSCMKSRRSVWKMEKSGLKNVISELTFDRFKALEPWQEKIKDSAMKYAESLDGWLLFCGQVGSGKTHLCSAVCRERLLKGDAVTYMPWRDDVAQLKSLAFDSIKRSDRMSELKNAQILYIDDLFKTGRAADGTCNPTGADIGIAFEIINYRYINHLPTIVSTEKTPQELVAIDEATGSRIIEMAGNNVYSIGRDPRRNYRMRGVVSV